MDLKERALNLVLDGLDNLVAAAKLEFAISTGAVALFLHLLLEARIATWLLILIACSAVCFTLSSVQCIYGLLEASNMKIGIARALAADVERRGDFFLKESSDAIEGFKRRMGRMDRVFSLGMAFAAAFVIGLLVARLKAN